MQVAVENYFINYYSLYSDQADYKTLKLVVEKHMAPFVAYTREVTADSDYCSEGNLLHRREHGIRSYIKLQTRNKRDFLVNKENIGKYYYMMYLVEEDFYPIAVMMEDF